MGMNISTFRVGGESRVHRPTHVWLYVMGGANYEFQSRLWRYLIPVLLGEVSKTFSRKTAGAGLNRFPADPLKWELEECGLLRAGSQAEKPMIILGYVVITLLLLNLIPTAYFAYLYYLFTRNIPELHASPTSYVYLVRPPSSGYPATVHARPTSLPTYAHVHPACELSLSMTADDSLTWQIAIPHLQRWWNFTIGFHAATSSPPPTHTHTHTCIRVSHLCLCVACSSRLCIYVQSMENTRKDMCTNLSIMKKVRVHDKEAKACMQIDSADKDWLKKKQRVQRSERSICGTTWKHDYITTCSQ